MKILHIVNRKGGVGKTTIALHAAWYFAEKRRVLFLELDDQRNASMVLKDHALDIVTSDLLTGEVDIPGLDEPGMHLIAADDGVKNQNDAQQIVPALRRNILSASTGYDLCIIDSGPSSSSLNLAPLLFATHALAPIGVNKFSMQGVTSLLQSILGAKQKYNRGLDFLGLLPNMFVPNQPNQKAAMEQIIEGIGTAHLFSGYLTHRQGYENVAVTREPVWNEGRTASKEAGREIRFVLGKIENRLWQEEVR